MKNLIIAILTSFVSITAIAQTNTLPPLNARSILIVQDILTRKTTITPTVLDRITSALDYYEQQKIKSQKSFVNKPKQLVLALDKISALKQKQLLSIIPADEYKKLSAEDILTICK